MTTVIAMTCGTSINWGDVPTWLATLGAFAAAGLAVWAVRIELGRDRQRDLEDHRALAEGVSAWLDADGIPPVAAGAASRPACMIANVGSQPVYELHVTVAVPGPDSRVLRDMRVLPPAAREVVPLKERFEDLTRHLRLDDDGSALISGWVEEFEGMPLTVVFTDARGLRWRRNADGALEEVPKTAG